ncbi:hypothetical protein C9F11_43735 (plasmid) [Streptomyces sp. YIM 121038]|uniref:CIS tube protein n=1 Tax=Streptomyces sp. YIM 121038 TaxID=2136401 RepID=UPI001110D315|nr:LysM peptidoglycan-binding domain-containing protein [Streptomyces sp. YIM 121038]QCX82325.1 hypothetical protein C9F11_43735 [Streptomyces sp. YIM 121038]
MSLPLSGFASGFASGAIAGNALGNALFGGALVRAALVVHDPPTGSSTVPGRERNRLVFHFNPESLQISKQSEWARHVAKCEAKASKPEFSGAQPRSLSLPILLDSGSTRGSVQDEAEMLMACCTPTPQSVAADRPSPPWVRLEWGRLRTMAFTAVVTHVDVTYTMFAGDGLPLRAECSLTLEEVGGAVARQNPTSGGPGGAGSHVLVQGESLASLAYRHYGDASRWREIARSNRIDDPDGVVPGDRLMLPTPADEGGGEPGGYER